MNALDAAAIAAVDPAGMIDDVLAQPHQLGDALWRAESAGVPRAEPAGGLCVCGMGGSAVGGDLALAVLDGRLQRPLVVARAYAPPSWVGPDTVALCASYSGDTEETLASYDAARAAGMPRVALTTGGELAARARADGVPVIGVPAGMQPRAAVVYMTVCTLHVAERCGVAPAMSAEVEGAAAGIERLAREWGPDGADDAPPKRLARGIAGVLPVVYGAGPTFPAALRLKTQLNENAKRAAFASPLPEADHNEVCGWDSASGLAAVFLDDDTLPPALRRRIVRTAELIEAAGAPVERVEARGQSALERLLSLVLLGDLASVYSAVLDGVDPTPVEPIERLKAALAEQP